jgi:hypothetical protein
VKTSAQDGVRQFLDIGTGIPTEPIALSLVALTHFISEEDDGVYDLVRGYVAALAPGSFLVLSQLTPDVDTEKMAQAVEHFRRGGTGLYPRRAARRPRPPSTRGWPARARASARAGCAA